MMLAADIYKAQSNEEVGGRGGAEMWFGSHGDSRSVTERI